MSLVINMPRSPALARFSRYVHWQHAVQPTATEAAVNDSKLVWTENSHLSYTENVCFFRTVIMLIYLPKDWDKFWTGCRCTYTERHDT